MSGKKESKGTSSNGFEASADQYLAQLGEKIQATQSKNQQYGPISLDLVKRVLSTTFQKGIYAQQTYQQVLETDPDYMRFLFKQYYGKKNEETGKHTVAGRVLSRILDLPLIE